MTSLFRKLMGKAYGIGDANDPDVMQYLANASILARR